MSKFIEEPKNFLEVMVNLEKAINEAHNYAEKRYLQEEITERKWYANMKCLEAMTEIKCAMDSSIN